MQKRCITGRTEDA